MVYEKALSLSLLKPCALSCALPRFRKCLDCMQYVSIYNRDMTMDR